MYEEGFTLPVVHIFMATYNGCTVIEDQINSILNQKGVEVKLHIQDDCSSDGTWEWLKAFTITRKEKIEIKQSSHNQGSNETFFDLIDSVSIDKNAFYAFSDQDDIWLPQKWSCPKVSVNSDKG
jgi:rhamnosyltransferase